MWSGWGGCASLTALEVVLSSKQTPVRQIKCWWVSAGYLLGEAFGDHSEVVRDSDNTASTRRADLYRHLPELGQVPLIGIIRGYPPSAAIQAGLVAHASGIGVLEVTMDSPGALEVVEDLTGRKDAPVVGVGSVTDPSQVASAARARARFVVTPAYLAAIVEACLEHGIVAIPGVATPTEILTALQDGVPAVKIFPAKQLGGPSFLRAVAAPLGHPPMVPTGGVGPDNVREYMESGAVAVGAGSSLFSSEIAESSNWRDLEKGVSIWIEALG